MEHEERVRFGKDLAEMLNKRHGEDLLYVGAFGSLARNEDRKDSDIDMMVVTKTKKYWPAHSNWPEFQLKDIAVGLCFKTLDELDADVGKPNFKWPYRTWRTINTLTFYDKMDLKRRYRQMIDDTPEQVFKIAAQRQIIEAFSALGKLKKNAGPGGGIADARSAAVICICQRLDVAVALVNRGLLPGDYGFKNLSYMEKFEKVPKDYIRLSKIIWESGSAKEICDATLELWSNVLVFAHDNGISLPSYNSIKEVPLWTWMEEAQFEKSGER